MASAQDPESPVVPETAHADERKTHRAETRRGRGVGSRENVHERDGPLESDMSDHEAPKEFKEGGYGWYVWAKLSRWV